MQLAPVTAVQQQAAAAAAEGGSAVQRSPVFELQVLITQSLEELVFAPEPEQFQVRLPRTFCLRFVAPDLLQQCTLCHAAPHNGQSC
jgi:hypothetical protein